jgi:hypothetical protein
MMDLPRPLASATAMMARYLRQFRGGATEICEHSAAGSYIEQQENSRRSIEDEKFFFAGYCCVTAAAACTYSVKLFRVLAGTELERATTSGGQRNPSVFKGAWG